MERKGPVDLSTTKVIFDTFFVSATKVFFLLLKPVRGVILGRLLGPAVYGIMNIPVPYVQISLILSNIGFTAAVAKLMPEHLQAGRRDLSKMIFRASVFLTFALALLWMALLILFAPKIVRGIAHRPDALGPMVVYSLIIPFMAVNTIYASILLAVQRGKLRAKITAIHGILNVALPIICAFLWRRQAMPVIAGFLTAEIIGALVFVLLFNRQVLSAYGRESGALTAGVRSVFGFGFLFFFANLGWNVLNSIDRFMVTYYLPVEQYGFYSMAAQVITAFNIISGTVGTALVPSLAVARSLGNRRIFDRQIQSVSRFTLIALVPITAIAFVLSGDFFRLVLPSFLPSVPIIQILAFIGFVDIFCRVAWSALVAYGKGGQVAFAYITASIWNIVWNRLLIPPYGLMGAAVATLSSFVVLALLLQLMMRRTSGTHVRPMNLVHPLLASLVFWLLGLLFAGQGHLLRLLIVSLGGSALYIMIALLTRLLRRSDFEQARVALEPRAAVFHVGLALRLISLLERFSR
jgi:stage V sporulation protein B